MAKNSIGQFIAALRKANGMTQQDVADRLNVSNKAVSRWERDECAPDISLIPALAEMFGVTCDELLKGERITESMVQDRKEPKVEKQVKNMINRTISAFKTQIWIALAIAVAGYVCMMGISYGAYRPVVGFSVMLLLEAVAFVMAVLAVNKVKTAKSDNELFEEAEISLIAKLNKSLGCYSFNTFFTIISVIVLSLPFLFFRSEYEKSVLSFDSYIQMSGVIVFILAVVFFVLRNIFISWITDGTYTKAGSDTNPILKKMNIIQLSLVVTSGVLFIIAPCFFTDDRFSAGEIIAIAAVICGLLINMAVFTVFIIRNKEERNRIILPGIRNLLMFIPAVFLSRLNSVSLIRWGDGPWERNYKWHLKNVWIALGTALVIYVVFKIPEIIKRKKQ